MWRCLKKKSYSSKYQYYRAGTLMFLIFFFHSFIKLPVICSPQVCIVWTVATTVMRNVWPVYPRTVQSWKQWVTPVPVTLASLNLVALNPALYMEALSACVSIRSIDSWGMYNIDYSWDRQKNKTNGSLRQCLK